MIRVVVADDDVAFRDVLVDILLDDGRFDLVGTADDAESAVAVAGEVRPDLVVLDVRMPGGGPTAADGIRRVTAGATRTVALSAQAGSGHVLSMLRSGASGYLAKGNVGVDLPDLLVRVARGEVVVAAPGADRFMAHLWSPATGDAPDSSPDGP
ncbi:hypothetical protein GCM10027596_01230 [Nocardioides korecus]